MRVIAGSAGGIRLVVPKRGVRPTMDRVKAAIFSSLGDAVVEARILDLFAGSGALGIEALSRGVSSVDIVFADPPYEKTEDGERFTEKLLANEELPQLMDADGIFVLEKWPAEALPQMKQWHLVRQKTYGANEVLFLSGVRNQKIRNR